MTKRDQGMVEFKVLVPAALAKKIQAVCSALRCDMQGFALNAFDRAVIDLTTTAPSNTNISVSDNGAGTFAPVFAPNVSLSLSALNNAVFAPMLKVILGLEKDESVPPGVWAAYWAGFVSAATLMGSWIALQSWR